MAKGMNHLLIQMVAFPSRGRHVLTRSDFFLFLALIEIFRLGANSKVYASDTLYLLVWAHSVLYASDGNPYFWLEGPSGTTNILARPTEHARYGAPTV